MGTETGRNRIGCVLMCEQSWGRREAPLCRGNATRRQTLVCKVHMTPLRTFMHMCPACVYSCWL